MTTADNTAPLSDDARQSLLARHPLVFYCLIAYAFSWLFELPLALSEDGVGLLPFSWPIPFLVTVAIGTFGPSVAAFIILGATEGRAGIGRLLRRMVLWRVGLRWYLFALLGIPVMLVLGAVVLPGALASFQGVAPLDPLALLGLFGLFVFVFFLGGPLGEEPGWRGFALPRLQRLHGPLVGSLILGLIWGLWHLPLVFIPAWGLSPTFLNIVIYVLAALSFTIVFTWVFNNTRGSVLMAILLHASNNIFNGSPLAPISLFPIVTSYGSQVYTLVGFGVVALLVIALTRGHLGYQHYQQEEDPDLATASRQG
jgi:membrane protease YdiL (CAAX protease family)